MTDTAGPTFFNVRARGDWVRLRTLIVLRWLAITGQSAAVLIASRLLDFDLPLTLCALVISLSVSVNLVAFLTHPSEKRLTERGTMLSLFFDLAQVVAMLLLTGGLDNPFALLMLAPVTIAATVLRLRSIGVLALAAVASIPLLHFAAMPLKRTDGTVLDIPDVYAGGLATALVIGIVFLSFYTRRVAIEGFRMSEALNATQIALAREQRLAAIGGIAAAAAHELGTPLATIKLVAGELARELAHDPALAEDARLIRQEAERCGHIMADLSRGGRDDSHVKQAPVSAVVEEAAAPHAERGKRLVIRVDGLPLDDGPEDQPEVLRRPELVHGLRNVIQNAVDFAATTVWIDIAWSEQGLRIAVGDDGPGFSLEILPRLGEPYVSTRARGMASAGDEEYEGMGLGLFIARTLLERTGASLTFANGSDELRRRARVPLPAELAQPPGAIIEIVWPTGTVEVDTSARRAALGENRRFGQPA